MKLINNWIEIKDYSELPNTHALWVHTDKGRTHLHEVYVKFSSICEVEKVTHYQIISEPTPPNGISNICNCHTLTGVNCFTGNCAVCGKWKSL